jgi:hypothetical protein
VSRFDYEFVKDGYQYELGENMRLDVVKIYKVRAHASLRLVYGVSRFTSYVYESTRR